MQVIPLFLLLWLSVIVEGTCIDRLPSDRQEVEALLSNPPSNVSIINLRFAEQRAFYGTMFTCNGCITKVTFAASSTSAGDTLPELGVWQDKSGTVFNLLVKSSGILLHPTVINELDVLVEGSSQTVHIHEVIPDQPLLFSPGQFPGLFSPDEDTYRLVPYLLRVTGLPTDDRSKLLSFFQVRTQVQTDGRIVIANGDNLLPVMALEISTDINGSCTQPSRTNSPLPSTSFPHPTSSPPPTSGFSTATIILVAVLPVALILLVCTLVIVTTVVCLTCRPSMANHHHNIQRSNGRATNIYDYRTQTDSKSEVQREEQYSLHSLNMAVNSCSHACTASQTQKANGHGK